MKASFAAFTTIFTPPCSITWFPTATKVPSQYPPAPTQAIVHCEPSFWEKYIEERGFDYYSPAICPSGFYVGPSCIVTRPKTSEGFPAVQDSETAAYCIPHGHVCTSDTTDFREGALWSASRTDTIVGARVTIGPAIQIRGLAEDPESLETYSVWPGTIVTTTTPVLTYPEETTDYPYRTRTYSTSTELVSILPLPTSYSSLLLVGPYPTSQTTSTRNNETETLSSPATSTSETTTPPSSTTTSTSETTSLPSSTAATASETTTLPSSTAATTSEITTLPSPTAAPASGCPDTETEEGAGKCDGPPANITIATAILTSIIAIFSIYAILRRYRRYRAGDTKEFLPCPFSLSKLSFFSKTSTTTTTTTTKTKTKTTMACGSGKQRWRRSKLPDAELGIDGPVPELGSTYARGTRENPAELPSERVSWKMRVSRMLLTARARRSTGLGSS
ncbi:hypothetical protein F5B17DRAFT_450435 [Nemania serpens]|nr:hypothetical protein F5B17DRAFT_450435 [Nemania serpens]